MDKESFSQAVLGCEHTLYRVAKSILFCDSDCEDAVQEAILKAYKKINTLKDEQYFKTWLVRILINECYRINKSEHKTYNIEDFSSVCNRDNSDVSHELYAAIIKLPEKIRITIVLFYIEGYSVTEIKGILKIPEGTVKSRLSTGRKQLKIYMEE